MFRRSIAVVTWLWVATGCSWSHDTAGSIDESKRPLSYYRDVKPIVDAKCTMCHVDGGIGPLPLTSYDEVSLVKELIAHDVSQGVMPPWRAEASLDTFAGDRRLTQEQKDIIVRWVEQDAPEGDAADEPPPEPQVKRGLTRVDGTLSMADAFTPSTGQTDEYRCFPLKWPYEETQYITGLSIEPGRSSMVHHGVLYFVQPENAAGPLAKDDAADGLGYPCTGVSENGRAAWINSYEPGGFGEDIPGGMGFEVRPGSVFVLQMHYNTLNGIGPDQSRVDFSVEDHVDRIAQVLQISNPLWIAGLMQIPAGAPDVVHRYRGPTSPRPATPSFDVFTVDLHMHTLGSAGSIGITRGETPDTREVLLNIPQWAFAWQETYVLNEPVRVNPGDQLYVECRYDNTAEHQLVIDGERIAPRDVNWGDNTTDEMCVGSVLVGPVQ